MNAQKNPDMAVTTLPLSVIDVVTQRNPRRRFRALPFARLVDSIRTHGLAQPISVRATDDGRYCLIAGERRYRAFTEIGLTEIPVLVRDVDVAGALRLAMIENVDRENLSIAEEALSAQALLDSYDGDREAAARGMGWSLKRLDNRLALLHCSENVMEALLDDKISIGHGELLSTLPQDTQDKVLSKVLASGATVVMLREQLQGVSIPLEQGIFDRTQCNGCPHNSSVQRGLFDEAIAAGHCTNKPCFNNKTQQALAEKGQALKDDFAIITFRTEKVANSTIALVADGPTGVGPEQFSKCKGCAHRGAIIDDRMGATTGYVEAPHCFNLTCHAENVAAYKSASAVATQREEDAATAESQHGNPVARQPTKPSAAAAKGKHGAATAKATPLAVAIQMAGIRQRAASAALETQQAWPLALALFATIRLIAIELAGLPVEKVVALLGIGVKPPRDKSGRQTGWVVALATLPVLELQRAQVVAAGAFLSNQSDAEPKSQSAIDRRELVSKMVAVCALDLAPHTRIDGAFLEAHTKAGIESILEESGFKGWTEAQDKGTAGYKALVTGPKAALVKGVLDSEFNFAGYVPSAAKVS
jgi:ParB family chromosome partitioning protein